MEIRRASDDVLLCNVVMEWSGWDYDYAAPVIRTVTGVPYIQPIGVAIELQELTLRFAPDTPGSNENKYRLLVDAHRKGRLLRFRDSEGVWNDCYVYEPLTRENSERWKEVRTKDVKMRKCVLLKRGYTR